MLGEPSTAGSRSAPAPVLRTCSTIKKLHSRLRELGAPIYGTTDELFRRLCEYEEVVVRKKKGDEYLENRRKELEGGDTTSDAKDVTWSSSTI